MSLNREGKSYRHRQTNALIMVVKTRFLSRATARHTVLVLDEGNQARYRAGSQVTVDEVPAEPFLRDWEEV